MTRRFACSTKAGTLAALAGRTASATVPPLARIKVGDWRRGAAGVLALLDERFGDGALAVRSSARLEDRRAGSLAGHFKTALGVQGTRAITDAIDAVIASYGAAPADAEEVLIQPMLRGVRLSGVAFSRDPSSGAPYRVINHASGADTASVTGGAGCPQTFVAAACRPATVAELVPPDMARVLALLDELEGVLLETALDIEFAFAAPGDTLYLLQARPLLIHSEPVEPAHHAALLGRVAAKITAAQRPHPFLHGRSTVFGVMPDWNPAEIIGIRPRPLALSLYRELVTDAIWAYQRHNYGYRNLRSFPLLVNFAGQPYIDVRLSFNSFIPNQVGASLGDRLVDYYIDRLVAAPALHDKIEFEIVFSCYTLDLPQRMDALRAAGFSARDCAELADSLRKLTNRVLDRDTGIWRADAAKLDVLSRRREQWLASNLEPVARIYWLLEDCKRYGTLPFAGLARAGFIAVQMLKSLVAVGVFSLADYAQFMTGLNTVSSQLARDFSSMARADFLEHYGHLRPGTYDILSARYDEAPEQYFGARRDASDSAGPAFALSLAQMRAIAALLKEHGLSSDVVALFDFLQAGIELREYAKFIFTRNLSDALALFNEWGAGLGFSSDDLSYANIKCIAELYAGSDDPRAVLAASIAEGRLRYRDTAQLWLPPLVTAPQQVWAFHVPDCEPNFVTQSQVSAPVATPAQRERLAGAIVCIASADPGFDWLFSHPIAGLVTAYGGVNSHMAIRAGELGLPAVIGAGETLFRRWSGAARLHIDCAGRRVEVLS